MDVQIYAGDELADKIAKSNVNYAVAMLNSALASDREAITELFAKRVECNKSLADHPTIQVAAYNLDNGDPQPDGPYTLRALGLINGLFGIKEDGYSYITMETDNTGMITKFEANFD